MDLYIYSPTIEQQGVIDSYSSFRWRRRFFEPGEFELHCPATSENLSLLIEGNVIHRLDRKEGGLIEGVAVSTSENGDEIAITGRFLSSKLSDRIITPTINFSGAAEVAMRQIVSDNAITARPISYLSLGTLNNFAPTVNFQATWKTVLDVLITLSKSSNIGFRVRIDVPNKALIFETYQGTDRTVTQSVIPYVLFSNEFNNIVGPTYTLNSQNYKNYAIVGGEGEGAARVIVEVDQTNDGKNIISVDQDFWESGHYSIATGAEEDLAGRIRLKQLLKVSPLTAYYFNTNNTDYYFVIRSFDNAGNLVSSWGGIGSSVVRTTTANESYLGVAIYCNTVPTYAELLALLQSGTINPFICLSLRRELWVDAKDLTQGNLALADYQAQLTQRGLEKLAELEKSESFSADAVNTENFGYLTDWDLGDIVSFEKWGIRLDQRITEVEEVDEGGVITVTPVCGTPLPEVLDLGSD